VTERSAISELATPTQAGTRIESLDVLRGFALLGILLLNIIGMGMYSSAYFSPLIGAEGALLSLAEVSAANYAAWITTDMLFEGAMRCLFSMLFGAGVVLFTTGPRGKSAALHYRRTFWLLIFGVADAYLLLWSGDILMVYAVGGALLYFVREVAARRLFIAAGVLLAGICMFNYASGAGIEFVRDAAVRVEAAELEGKTASDEDLELALVWWEFEADFAGTPETVAAELDARRASYASAFSWNWRAVNELLSFAAPLYLLPDALVMMLFGMALFKIGVLDGSRSRQYYQRMLWGGFGVGLALNLYEALRAAGTSYDVLSTFGYFQPTYHLGRFGIALGYIGVVMLVCNYGALPGLRARLAAVGRMALTNYLMHSLIALLLFTGAGFALVGVLERWQLYPVVLVIWLLQLWYSPWWLQRFRFGPLEWLWRWLTYSGVPKRKVQ